MVEKPGCKICGRYGHEESVCYEVIGYPPGWGTRGRGRGSRGARNNQGGRGAGRNRSYGRESAAFTIHQEEPNFSGPATASNSSAGTGPRSSERAHRAIPGLTSEQMEQLLSNLDTPKPGYEKLSGKDLWMLDSGASAHMVGDVKLVSNLRQVSPIAIGLPNGDCTVARNVGSVTLGDDIKLDNVLYVPNLNCNLVSVSKLCK